MQPSLFDDLPTSEPPPIDQGERDFASDPLNHVVLEASAGTGKTKVLVDRYVNLIEAGVDPRNILAITFTRKAAAEMRDRVLTSMRERKETSPAMKARWLALKDRVAEINVSTIDAFCFGLLREFPLEANVDPAFEIADETEVPRFRAEAIELTLRACRETLVSDEPVRLLMALKSANQLRGALDRLLDARHVSLSAVREFVARQVGVSDVATACRAFVDQVAALLQRNDDRQALLARGPLESPRFRRLRVDLTAVAEGTFDVANASDVRRLQRALEWYFLTKAGEPRKRLADDVKAAFATDADKKAHPPVVAGMAADVAGTLDALERAINGVLARGLLRILEEAVSQFDRLMADHSVLDFPAMLDRAVQLLGRQEEFARSRLKLQSRYHHLLVDEFQDTSQAQWDLVTLLTQSWAEGEGAEDTKTSIFIVGDRKQSIYRFRYAEVTLMDVAADFIGALRPGVRVRRAIQHSFRSVPELLGFVNAISAEMRSYATIAERFQYRAIDRFPCGSPPPGALAAEDAHHRLHAGLGGGVVGLPIEPLERGDAPKAHDGASVAHDLQPILAAVENSGEVYPDHGTPILEGHLRDGPVANDRGVVNEEVDPSTPGAEGFHHRANGLRIRNICSSLVGATGTLGVEFGGEAGGIGTRTFKTGVVQDHRGAGAVEGARDLRPDALRGTGDEHCLSGEINRNGHERSVALPAKHIQRKRGGESAASTAPVCWSPARWLPPHPFIPGIKQIDWNYKFSVTRATEFL